MAFELASTNLVAELSIILIVLMGWQFALAEFAGGPLMVVIMAVSFRILLSRKLVQEARVQADKGVRGVMEGHAEMDMSVEGGGLFWQRIKSSEGITAISHYFVMDVGSRVEGYRWWPAHRWRARCMGAAGFLENVLPRIASSRRDAVGANCRTTGCDLLFRLLRSAIFRWRRCFGTVESALAA